MMTAEWLGISPTIGCNETEYSFCPPFQASRLTAKSGFVEIPSPKPLPKLLHWYLLHVRTHGVQYKSSSTVG